MSDSTSQIDQISSSSAQKEILINALADAMSPSALFGRRASTTTGLTWGYYGGDMWVDGVLTSISNGTVVLTGSTTNYVEATRAGVVSKNTTGFTAGSIPLYTVVTNGSSQVTSYTDVRISNTKFTGRLSRSVAGSSNVTLTAAEARNDILEFTGTLTGNIDVIVPLGVQKWLVYNNTSGAFTLRVIGSSGTGVTITQGSKATIYADGTNIVSGAESGSTSWAGAQTVSIGLAANTSGDGVALVDPTAATSGNQRYSPRLRFTGQGWKTNATAASQTVDWIVENQPVQGTANPTTELIFSSQVNAGGYTRRMSIDSAGTLIVGDKTANISTYQPSQSLFWMQSDGQQEIRVNSYTSSAANSTNLVLFKGRGTAASPANIQNGDTVGSIIPCAVSGSAYYHVGSINAVVNGTFTSGQNPPSRFDFYVGPADTAPTLQFTVADKGLGVGTTNPNPIGYGRAITVSDATNFVGFTMQYAGADADGNFVGEYSYAATGNTLSADTRVASILAETSGSTANWRGGKISFRTRADGGGFGTGLVVNNDQSVVIGASSQTGTGTLRVAGSVTINSSTLIQTKTSFTNGAAAASGTLTNAPAAGNPTKWIPIDDNGTTRYIPAW